MSANLNCRDGVPSEGLQCDVIQLRYDFERARGCLILPRDNCVDMTGAIALFKRIDPRVTQIETFAGVNASGGLIRDTTYRRDDNGWHAYDLKGRS